MQRFKSCRPSQAVRSRGISMRRATAVMRYLPHRRVLWRRRSSRSRGLSAREPKPGTFHRPGHGFGGIRLDANGNPNYRFNPLLADIAAHVRMMDEAGIDGASRVRRQFPEAETRSL